MFLSTPQWMREMGGLDEEMVSYRDGVECCDFLFWKMGKQICSHALQLWNETVYEK